jgi:DtxR family Mn-dependent transcriptional regulator
MLPSHTVENYLKAIFQAQAMLPTAESLVPMGQLASALGVVPGTATTMVKALSESGLVRYEPYVGVRLTRAGEKLAALVLRRHRLIELFLVKVMGMSWTEVHDEAEHLEHAVSDHLIERIDEMLGRPAVDPHGDPIPGPEGTVDHLDYETLLTCPLRAAMTVSRVTDQDSEFLKFIERHDLKPGEVVQVEERDSAADSVKLRGRNDREFTIGARAASKVLVRALHVIAALCILSGAALAQPSSGSVASEPFQIMDNSFLVEEAFNQEAGIFQNIFGAARFDGAWSGTFTQEWPVRSQAHQFSYTLSVLDGGAHTGFGDVLLNYRYQASMDGPGRAAFSPRVSLILPTGRQSRGLGDGTYGLQFNLPVSKQTGNWHWHWNGGLTWFPSAEAAESAGSAARSESLESPFIAGSAIYRLRPMLHVMMETVLDFEESVELEGTTRQRSFTLSPGIRGGWNLGDHQLVLGVALPITWVDSSSDAGTFLYLSYELPFRK